MRGQTCQYSQQIVKAGEFEYDDDNRFDVFKES